MSARVRVESDMGWSLLWGTKIGCRSVADQYGICGVFFRGFNRARDENFYLLTKQISPRVAKLTEKAKSTTTVKPLSGQPRGYVRFG